MRAAVLVLGDVGRSPRMMYHSKSLARKASEVYLIGYSGSELPEFIERDNHIHFVKIYQPYALPRNFPKFFYLLYAPIKILFLFFSLVWTLSFRLPRVDLMFVQTPPAIPTLIAVNIFRRIKEFKLVLDWHNFGYSLMRINLGRDHWAVKLAESHERKYAGIADLNLCVTDAMNRFLVDDFRVSGPTVTFHDRPQSHFFSLTNAETHNLVQRLSKGTIRSFQFQGDESESIMTITEKNSISLKPCRPAILVTSTSWTDDENVELLLSFAQKYDSLFTENHMKASRLPDILILITGKGPNKKQFEEKIEHLNFAHVKIETVWLKSEDYPKLLGISDIGISLHESSSKLDLPMKIVDMFGCGLPVCAYEYECIEELVKPMHNGMLFQTSDDLLRNIMTMLNEFPNNKLASKFKSNIKKEFHGKKNRWINAWECIVWPEYEKLKSWHKR